MTKPAGSCQTCKHKALGAERQLECRRFPPVASTIALGPSRLHVHTAWPVVPPDAWCWEWKLAIEVG